MVMMYHQLDPEEILNQFSVENISHIMGEKWAVYNLFLSNTALNLINLFICLQNITLSWVTGKLYFSSH